MYRKIGEFFPRVPRSVIHLTAIVGLVVTVSTAQIDPRTVIIPQLPHWARNAGFYLDALVLQFLSVLVATYAILVYLEKRRGIRLRALNGIGVFAFLGFQLFCVYLVTIFVLKPAFGYQRYETFSESFLLQYLRPPTGGGDSCPSGFVLRQIWLLLQTVAIACSSDKHDEDNFYCMLQDKRLSASLTAVLLLTGLVAFSRISLDAHSQFDVAMSIGTGIYFYWLSFYFFALCLGQHQTLSDLLPLSGIFAPLFLFYALEMPWVVGAYSIVPALVIGLMQSLPWFSQSEEH